MPTEAANPGDTLLGEQSIVKIHPVVLSGGSGTRLWPLSRAALPKQLLPLLGERTLFQDTVLRLRGMSEAAAPIVICGHDHRFLVAEQLRQIGVIPADVFLEPVARNTAPALAVAALAICGADPNGLLLALPADHSIRDLEAFHAAIRDGAAAAREGRLLSFGIVPDRPETGYGYIRCGEPLPYAPKCRAVAQFVEKPDAERAGAFVDAGGHYWNSGMFLFPARAYLEELGRLRPDILAACRAAYEGSAADLDFRRLESAAFAGCPAESVDYAVMEHTELAAVLPVDIGWNDVGSWSALWELGQRDEAGNVLRGDVHTADVGNSLIFAESRMVSAIGLEDVIVVETPDAVLVAHKDRVQQVKEMVGRLGRQGRSEHLSHRRVFRPWGWYEGIDGGERFQVKRIMVKPGEKLSLQMHHHRAEHWVVVSGTAKVTREEEVVLLGENESTFIPLGHVHRLENPGRIPLHMIEVQSGPYLGEDDIVRFEDVYQRQ